MAANYSTDTILLHAVHVIIDSASGILTIIAFNKQIKAWKIRYRPQDIVYKFPEA